MLDSVADALRLSEAERRYLHALIEPVASVPSAPLDAANVHAHIRDLVADTNAMPYPVYAVDHRGGLIAWNTHAADWYADFSTDRAPNILWWLLTAPEARARLTHWNTDTREIVARTRFFIGTTAPDPAAEQLVQDLLVASDDFRQWWINHDVADQDIKRRTLTHPQLGQREFNLLVLHPAHDPSISIVFHLPG